MAIDVMGKYGPGTTYENDERMLPVYRIVVGPEWKKCAGIR